MKALEWLAAASHRKLILALPGADTVTITPRRQGWTVRTGSRVQVMDQVRLEDSLENYAFYGYREVAR